MSIQIGKVGSCCNNYDVRDGMFVAPYTQSSNTIPIDAIKPRLKANTGWSNYKNVKSGQYNRQSCWKCADFKGIPDAPGVYDLNITDVSIPEPNFAGMKQADAQYQEYQAFRMQNNPGCYGTDHVNYLNNQCAKVYPKRYMKGNWPDEQLIYTNAPRH